MDCGCKVVPDVSVYGMAIGPNMPPLEQQLYTVEFCKMHKAAPDMLAFLEWISNSTEVLVLQPGYTLRKIREKARQHVSKIRMK